ncbi:MAG: tyrosine-type recombinase/integrase [candidate division Zixibacteria bacterium]|nr:tyrosine-type recombinase/integrase [candidate division Zixibacteria bacterium]
MYRWELIQSGFCISILIFIARELLVSTCFAIEAESPIKPRYMDKIFERISEKVGFKIRPHLIRHSAATWAIKNGMSPAILQKILGHSSIKTTENYLHISGQDIRESYQRFSPVNALIE